MSYPPNKPNDFVTTQNEEYGQKMRSRSKLKSRYQLIVSHNYLAETKQNVTLWRIGGTDEAGRGK